MPQFDSQHVFAVVGVLVVLATACVLEFYDKRNERRRKSELVRSNLPGEHCARCGGTLAAWDGQFHDGNVLGDPGGYLPRIILKCTQCHAEQAFHVNWEGHLLNADVLLGLSREEHKA